MAVAAALTAVIVITGSMYIPVKTVVVEIINEGTTPDAASFHPSTASVQSGTTIVWKNTDASAHTVTSTIPSRVFDSGVMGPGYEFEFTFEDEGTFDYYCIIHPAMIGAIVVE